MYLFIPMMNKFAEAADKKSFTAVIAVILLLTTGSFIIGKDGFKFSEGYSPIWLMVMYLVGAYMKKFGVGAKMKWYSALLFYIISVGCNFALNVFLKDPMKKIFTDGTVNYLTYTSPFVILSAIFLFIFFSKLKFGKKTEKLINYITPAALGVYLIHTHPLVFNKLMKKYRDAACQSRHGGDDFRLGCNGACCIYNMYSNRPSENTAFQADKNKRTV